MRRVKTSLMGVVKKLLFSRKKGRFSEKKTSEPLVDGDLRWSIRLAEVGIDRGIEYEAVVQDEFAVETDVGLERRARRTGCSGRAGRCRGNCEPTRGNELGVVSWERFAQSSGGGG